MFPTHLSAIQPSAPPQDQRKPAMAGQASDSAAFLAALIQQMAMPAEPSPETAARSIPPSGQAGTAAEAVPEAAPPIPVQESSAGIPVRPDAGSGEPGEAVGARRGDGERDGPVPPDHPQSTDAAAAGAGLPVAAQDFLVMYLSRRAEADMPHPGKAEFLAASGEAAAFPAVALSGRTVPAAESFHLPLPPAEAEPAHTGTEPQRWSGAAPQPVVSGHPAVSGRPSTPQAGPVENGVPMGATSAAITPNIARNAAAPPSVPTPPSAYPAETGAGKLPKTDMPAPDSGPRPEVPNMDIRINVKDSEPSGVAQGNRHGLPNPAQPAMRSAPPASGSIPRPKADRLPVPSEGSTPLPKADRLSASSEGSTPLPKADIFPHADAPIVVAESPKPATPAAPAAPPAMSATPTIRPATMTAEPVVPAGPAQAEVVDAAGPEQRTGMAAAPAGPGLAGPARPAQGRPVEAAVAARAADEAPAVPASPSTPRAGGVHAVEPDAAANAAPPAIPIRTNSPPPTEPPAQTALGTSPRMAKSAPVDAAAAVALARSGSATAGTSTPAEADAMPFERALAAAIGPAKAVEQVPERMETRGAGNPPAAGTLAATEDGADPVAPGKAANAEPPAITTAIRRDAPATGAPPAEMPVGASTRTVQSVPPATSASSAEPPVGVNPRTAKSVPPAITPAIHTDGPATGVPPAPAARTDAPATGAASAEMPVGAPPRTGKPAPVGAAKAVAPARTGPATASASPPVVADAMPFERALAAAIGQGKGAEQVPERMDALVAGNPPVANQATPAAGTLAAAGPGVQDAVAEPASTPLQATLEKPVGEDGWGEELGHHVVNLATGQMKSAEFKLNPANLGPLEVRIEMSGDQATVQFSSAHGEVREAIAAALPHLREMFSTHHLVLTDIGVAPSAPSVPMDARGGQGGQNQGFDSQQQARSGQPLHYTGRGGFGAAEDEPAESSRPRQSNGSLSWYA